MLKINDEALKGECAAFGKKVWNGFGFENLRFSIMHGNGNVILVLDEKLSGLAASHVNKNLARTVCEFFRSVRVDGISFLRAVDGKVKVTFFDRDGTKEPMCGNGLRCSTWYAYEQGYISNRSFITTDDGEKWVVINDGVVHAGLGPGREFQKVADNQYFVFSSVPHLVVFVDELASIDVQRRGAALRYDAQICRRVNHPEGVHVDFVKAEPDLIRIRTYEVGVEGETLACGSGAAGAAFVAHQVERMPFPIRVETNCGAMTVDENEHGLVISGIVGYLFSNAPVRRSDSFERLPSCPSPRR